MPLTARNVVHVNGTFRVGVYVFEAFAGVKSRREGGYPGISGW